MSSYVIWLPRRVPLIDLDVGFLKANRSSNVSNSFVDPSIVQIGAVFEGLKACPCKGGTLKAEPLEIAVLKKLEALRSIKAGLNS